MKKALLVLLPFLFIMSCEALDEIFNPEEEGSPFVGTWDLTFMGEYENANCTGDLDSLIWAFAQAFELEVSVTFDENETFEMSTSSLFGDDTTETGIWYEEGCTVDLCISDPMPDGEVVLSSDENSFSITGIVVDHCEDSDGEETSYTDSTSCQAAGNYWIEASCSYMEYTKQ